MNDKKTSGNYLLLALAGGLIWAGAATAQVYTWTDEQGTVHYADMPDDEEAEMVAIESRRTNPRQIEEEVTQDQARRRVDNAVGREQAEIDAERNRIDAQNQAAREDGCKRAREAVTNYNTHRRFYKPLANGEREWMSEEEVAEAKAAAEQAVEQYCD